MYMVNMPGRNKTVKRTQESGGIPLFEGGGADKSPAHLLSQKNIKDTPKRPKRQIHIEVSKNEKYC